MQISGYSVEGVFRYYVAAIDALYEIGRAYYMDGRLGDATRLLGTSLQMIEIDEVMPQYRLKLLLLYGQVLIVEHLLTRGDARLMLATVQRAREIAEEVQDQQGSADSLSLLGQAQCLATTVESLKSGISPFVPRGQGKYEASLAEALDYQRQALKLREALRDTRGISESYFQIGLIHERWQEYEQAQEYYAQARQIAEEFGHPFEKTEPARHVALHALRSGKLEQAVMLASQALALREAAGFKPYLPFDHLLLRDAYLVQGDEEHARHHFEAASAIAEEMGMTRLVSSMPDIRNVLTNQGKGA